MLFALACSASIGMNVHLPPADTLDLAQELNVGWVRVDFNWPVVEASQGNRDWSVMDRVIGDAEARGLKIFATIGYAPAWGSASDDRLNDGPTNDLPQRGPFTSFITAAAQRYGTRVAAWGTWNEPNLEHFFEGTRQEWIDEVFAPTVDALKQGCPSCLIVGPELATIGDNHEEYLRAALQSRGNDLDAISWHIYSAFPEDEPGAGSTSDSFYNDLESHRVLDVNGAIIYEGPLSVREVQQELGFTHIPVWLTETGFEAAADDATKLEEQRQYIRRVVDAMQQRDWIERTFIYELTEEHPNGMWPDIHWGLALRTSDPDGSFDDNFDRKPAYTDLRVHIAAGCPAPPLMSSGAAGGAPATGGVGSGASGGAGGSGGARSSGGTGGDVSGGNVSGGNAATSSDGANDGGCGCRLADSRRISGAWLGLPLLVGFFRRRRN